MTSWSAPAMQNFVTIGLRVSAPRIRVFLCFWCDYSFTFVLGYSIRLYIVHPERILTQNNVVPGMEVPFWGRIDYILYLNP